MANYIFPNLPENIQKNDTITFMYSGQVQTWNPAERHIKKIKVECWGASGVSSGNIRGGNGGYASGNIEIGSEPIYLSVAQAGLINGSAFGGGGLYGGGGCSWIAKQSNPTAKEHLYIVAGGGGSCSPNNSNEHGGHGGGLKGLPPSEGTSVGNGGTQTSGGPGQYGGGNRYRGAFLQGARGHSQGELSGSGSGLYGGGGYWGGGSGGSSYIDGVQDGVTHDGSTSYGNTGDGRIQITILEVTFESEITGINTNGYIDRPNNTDIKRILRRGFDATSVKHYLNDELIGTYGMPSINTEYSINIPEDNFYNLDAGNYTLKVDYLNALGDILHTKTATFKKNSVDFNITTTINSEGYSYPDPFNITLTGTNATKIEVLMNDSLIGSVINIQVNTPTEINLITTELFNTIPFGNNILSFKIYRGTKLETVIGGIIYKKNKLNISVTGFVEKPLFEDIPPTITYYVSTDDHNVEIDNVSVIVNHEIIKSSNELNCSLDMNRDFYLSLENDFYDVEILVESKGVTYNKSIGKFLKDAKSMEITVNPIPIPTCDIVLSLDANLIKKNDGVSVYATNNAYDAEPVWEDITSRFLQSLEFVLLNKIKEEGNNWGLAIKIIVNNPPFKMSETIIGGFQTLYVEKETINNKERHIVTNSPINKNIKKINMKITILENQFLLGIDIDIEEKTNYFKEFYNLNMLNEEMVERLKSIGIDVTI